MFVVLPADVAAIAAGETAEDAEAIAGPDEADAGGTGVGFAEADAMEVPTVLAPRPEEPGEAAAIISWSLMCALLPLESPSYQPRPPFDGDGRDAHSIAS